MFAVPETSQRHGALFLQLDVEGLRLMTRWGAHTRKFRLDLKVLVVLQPRDISVLLTGVEGAIDGAGFDGLLAWVAMELGPALRQALQRFDLQIAGL